jgi:molybdopterin converting factor subunit 1
MMRIEVHYFAILRELRGLSRESVQTSAGTPGELYSELAERHGLPADSRFKVAVNDVFSDWSQSLEDGDQVVFIPPVAGG